MTDAAVVRAPEAVLDFWFGASPGVTRPEWFHKSADFDALIGREFRVTHDAALAGDLEFWRTSPRTSLAYVIVLDQFSRNLYRTSAQAFAGDARALTAARDIVWRQWDRAMLPVERQFVYLPFEHAEDAAMQAESLRLFAELDQITPPADPASGLLDWARRHAVIVTRFGRFPHRNALLGRATTPEEAAFLLEPGSSF